VALEQQVAPPEEPRAAPPGPVAAVAALFEAMRPSQWTKNLFVFAGLIFGRQVGNASAVEASVAAFCVFCLLSASVYLLNDVADREQDRQHPTKRHRPIASGRLSPQVALVVAVLLAIVGVGSSFVIAAVFAAFAIGYLALNLAYSFSLKNVVIVDVLCIAAFFVLRAASGAAAIGVVISHWLLICTVLLALFIALSKRRHELVLLEDEAANHRTSLGEYSAYLLDQMIAVVTASTLMAYVLYTVDARTVAEFGSDRLVYTVPFVIFGIFRYLYLIHQRSEGGSPDKIIVSDKPFLANLVLWAAAVSLAIYLH
jgi:4-hydroxybenzoate polyprenyltransferase